MQPLQMPEPYGYSGPGFEAYNSQKSPKIVLDVLLKYFEPKNCIDLGCGIGIWSRELLKRGIDTYSIDGDWIPVENLQIPQENFNIHNISQPFELNQDFDLALCLEVAEHIPKSLAPNLLDNICKHSDIILFSAAIPGQGGFEHVNERWQSSWVQDFQERGYTALDLIRPAIWGKKTVNFYYQQNIILFVKSNVLEIYNSLREYSELEVCWNIVHPDLYNRVRDPKNISIGNVLRNLRSIMYNYIKSRK